MRGDNDGYHRPERQRGQSGSTARMGTGTNSAPEPHQKLQARGEQNSCQSPFLPHPSCSVFTICLRMPLGTGTNSAPEPHGKQESHRGRNSCLLECIREESPVGRCCIGIYHPSQKPPMGQRWDDKSPTYQRKETPNDHDMLLRRTGCAQGDDLVLCQGARRGNS